MWTDRFIPRMYAVFCVVGFAVGFASAAIESEGGAYAPDSAFVIGSRVAYGVFAAYCAVMFIRCLRVGVWITNDALIVRNYHYSRTVPWDQIARFELPDSFDGFREAQLRLHLVDGSSVPVSACRLGLRNVSTPFRPSIDARNEHVRHTSVVLEDYWRQRRMSAGEHPGALAPDQRD